MNSECNLLILVIKAEKVWPQIGKHKISETRTVKILGIIIDILKFDDNLQNIFMEANRKLTALTRMIEFIDIEKTRILFKVFFWISV